MPASEPDPRAAGMPPGYVLYQLAVGHYVSRALALVTKLGVADLLGGEPRDAEALAGATDTHGASLRRVLRLLVSVGLFEEDAAGRFSLTAVGELLREDVPGSMKAAVNLFAGVGIQDSWKELEYCVRTGEPAFRKLRPDEDPFQEMAKDPEAAANFDKAMAAFAPQTAAAVAAVYDFSRYATLMDVGGGNGAILIGILKASPGLRGIVFEQPHVAERARKEVSVHGLDDRIEVVDGSFFDTIPPGADAILMKHVIHDWDDAKATAILETCRAALPPDGRLLILEGLYPPHVDRSAEARGAAANDVNMLVCTGGRQRAEAEFRALLAAGGFELVGITPTPARVVVLEAAPR